MGHFPVQTPGVYVIGTSAAASTLTAAYTGNTFTIKCDGMEEATLYISYVPETGQTNRYITFKIDHGETAADTYQESFASISTGTDTLTQGSHKFVGATGGTTYKLTSFHAIASKYMKVSFIEDGAANFGTITVRVVLSGL